MPVTAPPQTKYHPTERRKLLMTADVRFMWARVIDTKGAERDVYLWIVNNSGICTFNLEDISNPDKHMPIEPWLWEQLRALPLSRQFDALGAPKGKPTAATPASAPPEVARAPGTVTDDDLPEFRQL